MRGVFLIFLFVFCFSASAKALEVSGSYHGRLACDGVQQKLVLCAACKRAWFEALGGGSFLLEAGQFEFRPDWQVRFSYREQLSLNWQKNQAHHTSQDLFRLLQKDNFGADTASLILTTGQIQVGVLRSVPLKNGELVNLWFCENSVRAGPLVLRGMQLHYAGSQVGQAGSVEGGVDLGRLQAALGLGWHQREQDLARASVAEVGVEGEHSFLNLFWQNVEPGFVSLAAKSNKYTPDRKGWRIEAGGTLAQLRLSLNWRRHVNLAGTKNYDQLSLQLVSPGRDVSLELRLQPTRALIARYARGVRLIQFDVLKGTTRYDGQRGNFAYGLRFDGPGGIGRLEFKFDWGLAWRIIAKYDWLKERLHYSLLLRQQVSQGHFQVELGEYDRGNMHAGFGTSPALGISWQWEF